MVKWSKKATALITWLHSKTIILAHLCQLQIVAGLIALSVVHAVLTPWMAHYFTYQQVLGLKTQLILLIAQDEN